jgi:hypothetical protein
MPLALLSYQFCENTQPDEWTWMGDQRVATGLANEPGAMKKSGMRVRSTLAVGVGHSRLRRTCAVEL